MRTLYSRRLFVNRFNLFMSLLAMAFGLLFLFWILFTLFDAGLHALPPRSVHADDAAARQQGRPAQCDLSAACSWR